MKKYTNLVRASLLILLAFIVVAPLGVYAGSPLSPTAPKFYSIVPLPDLPITNDTSLSEYINAAFRLSISAAAILGVLMIMYGGFEYMTKEVTGKKDGKDRIRSAVIGLILLLVSWLILNVINPDILNLNVLRSVGGTSYTGETGVSPTTSTLGRIPDNALFREADPDALAERRQSASFQQSCAARGTPNAQYYCSDPDRGAWTPESAGRGGGRCPTGSARVQACW